MGKQIVPSECHLALRGIKRSGCTIEGGKEKRWESRTRQETAKMSRGMASLISPPPVTRSASARKAEQHTVKVETPTTEKKKPSTVEEALLHFDDLLPKNSTCFENTTPTHAVNKGFQLHAPILLQKV